MAHDFPIPIIDLRVVFPDTRRPTDRLEIAPESRSAKGHRGVQDEVTQFAIANFAHQISGCLNVPGSMIRVDEHRFDVVATLDPADEVVLAQVFLSGQQGEIRHFDPWASAARVAGKTP